MSVPRPPIAPRVRSRRYRHGEVVNDYYAWMRDKQDPRLLAYLDQENQYTEQATAGLAELRHAIYDDLAARTQQTDMSVPEFVHHEGLGNFWYYARTTDGLDYPSYHRCPAVSRDEIPDPSQGSPNGEELLLDVQALAEGSQFLALGTFAVSPNGRLAAYSVDRAGDERYRLHFLDLRSGALLPDQIEEVAAGGDWAGDQAFCYLTVDDAWRPDRLWRHRLGSSDPDQLLLVEPDQRFWLGVDASRNHRWLVVSAASKNTTECWLADLTEPDSILHSVGGRTEGLEYDIEVADDRLFIVHNRDAADFALAEAGFDCRSVDQWRPLWSGERGVRLLGVTAYDRCLVSSVRRRGLATVTLRYRDRNGDVGDETELAFAEPIYQVDADDGDEADTDRIRISYQSMITPDQVIEISLIDGSRRLLRSRPVLDHPVLGPYRSEDYRQRREWATAADGTRIPISLVYRADTAVDGSAPCLLYGYGAYEVSVPPSFSIARLSLLDRGCIYAIAHVRGGGELGRSWYEEGRLADKPHTFTDFLACIDHLVAAGYTRRDRLAIEGGSAGGLLVGAVLNLDPGCCAAALAAVPFVDALNTILNPDLPLTVMEWEEWGDPIHDRAAYQLMRSYSPYENIRPLPYPAILVTANLNDTRVEITEPAKWVARLRHDSAGGEVLLRTELVAGHGGRSGRYQAWQDIAFEWSWLLDRIQP